MNYVNQINTSILKLDEFRQLWDLNLFDNNNNEDE